MLGTRRQPRRMVAAAMLVIVLGAGLAVALAARHGSGGNPVAGRTAPAPHSAPDAGSPELPHVDLAGLRWSGYYGVELPCLAGGGTA